MLDAMFHDSESHVGNERVLSNDAAARPRPDRAARPAAADAGGPRRRPGVAARPGQRAVAPKVDQTTLVRVILPLDEAKGSH